jgi:carbamoyltransferase
VDNDIRCASASGEGITESAALIPLQRSSFPAGRRCVPFGRGSHVNVIGISGLDNSVAFRRRELPDLEEREYRIAQGFDSAAALVTDDDVAAAVAEERFTGEKSTGAFPRNAIQYCLEAAGLEPADIDHVAHGFAYRPMPFHQDGSLEQRRYNEVYAPEVTAARAEDIFPGWGSRFVSVPHHMAHAASAFYLSGFEDALIVVADGMGEIESLTVAVGKGDAIRVLRRYSIRQSLGILYSVFTLYLGFEMMMDEYKVMGLAPYGDPYRYRSEMRQVIELGDEGSYQIPLLAHNTPAEWETHRGALRALGNLFGERREPGGPVDDRHRDVAAAIQAGLEAVVFHVLEHFHQATGARRLCLAGGVALNCTVNGLIADRGMFDDMFVQPAAADDGSALGAALHVHGKFGRRERRERMAMPYWGPDLTEAAIETALAARRDVTAQRYDDIEELTELAARRLAAGEVVAWAQGRLEFGPRALGNRSILGDPRDAKMRDHINELIKQREEFRPFAPAVVSESANKYFEIAEGKERYYPHMLFVAQTRPEYRDQLGAVTHVDGSARLQTVDKEKNPRFWALLKQFEKLTGLPVLLNTSFNLKGQPIVKDPARALETFVVSNLDALIIGDYLVTQRDTTSGDEPEISRMHARSA